MSLFKTYYLSITLLCLANTFLSNSLSKTVFCICLFSFLEAINQLKVAFDTHYVYEQIDGHMHVCIMNPFRSLEYLAKLLFTYVMCHMMNGLSIKN